MSVAVVLVAVLAVALTLHRDRGGGVVVPPSGTVSADFVEEHPVFVVSDEQGSAIVLDAMSPHSNFPKVLAWCATSRVFEDLWHGSTFASDGTWLGGPAPTGMARYEVRGVDHGRAEVGVRSSPPARPEQRREVDDENWQQPGRRCDERTALYGPGNDVDPSVLEDLVVHEEPPEGTSLWIPTPARILGEAPAVPPGIWEQS